MLRLFFAVTTALSFASSASAWTPSEFSDLLDSRELSTDDIRYIQTGLALKGLYNAMIDGKWGRGTQRALLTYARGLGEQRMDDAPLNIDAIALSYEVLADFAAHDWNRYYSSSTRYSFLAPMKELTSDLSTDKRSVNLTDRASSLGITLTDGDASRTMAFHEYTLKNAAREPYTLRRDTTLITSARQMDGRTLYTRSDLTPNGTWSTIMVSATGSAAGHIAVVSGSILVGNGRNLTLATGGELEEGLIALADIISKDAEPPKVDAAARPAVTEPPIAETAPTEKSSGTGFSVSADGFVISNNHVVDGCHSIEVDGVPSKVIGTDASFDLSLLKMDGQHDRPFAQFAQSPAALNSDVTVAGYPLSDLLGGLNVTRGAVTSVKGLGGDGTNMQISAPVQPGNSGGPVVNAFGAVVGVVVSKLDAQLVQDNVGDIPQNVNFAIRSEIAKLFLYQNDVAPSISTTTDRLAPEDLAKTLQDVTHVVTCF
jgi:serine protease Do